MMGQIDQGSMKLYEFALSIDSDQPIESVVEELIDFYVDDFFFSFGVAFCEDDLSSITDPYLIKSRDGLAGLQLDSKLVHFLQSEFSGLAVDYSPKSFEFNGHRCYLFSVDGFGFYVLGIGENRLERDLIRDMSSLNKSVKSVCEDAGSQTDSEPIDYVKQNRDEGANLPLDSIVSSIQNPAVVLDVYESYGKVCATNKLFDETFDVTPQSERDGIEPVDTSEFDVDERIIDEKVVRGEPIDTSVRRMTAEGGMVNFRLQGSVVSDDPSLYLLTYTELSGVSRHEQAIQNLNVELTDILSSNGEYEICSRVVECVSDFTGAKQVDIHLYDRKNDCIDRIAAAGEPLLPDRCEGGSVLWDVYDGSGLYFDHISEDDPNFPTPDGIESLLFFPIGGNGVLTIAHEEPEFFDDASYQFCILVGMLANSTLNSSRRIHSLESINSLVKESLEFSTREEVVQVGVDKVLEALELPLTAIWEHKPPFDQLVPAGQTDVADELIGEPPIFTPENSKAWDVYESGDSETIQDMSANVDGVHNPDSEIQSEFITPIGDYGVLASGSARPNDITEVDERVAETLASTLDTSIQHIDNRKQLRILENVVFRVLRHNVRNKLSLIKGNAQIVSDETDSMFIEKVVDQSERLEDVIENTRTMRYVIKNKNERESIPVSELVDDVMAQVEEIPSNISISASANDDFNVVAHPQLSNAISHLVKNSVEHAYEDDESGEIVINCWVNDDKASISVVDHGCGIPDHEIEAVNNKDESVLEHGSGLGLWIVDRVVDFSDGRLSFDTSDGTVAEMLLPAEIDSN